MVGCRVKEAVYTRKPVTKGLLVCIVTIIVQETRDKRCVTFCRNIILRVALNREIEMRSRIAL